MSKKRDEGESPVKKQASETDSESDCKYRELPKINKSQGWQLLQPLLRVNSLQAVMSIQVGISLLQVHSITDKSETTTANQQPLEAVALPADAPSQNEEPKPRRGGKGIKVRQLFIDLQV